MAAGNKPQHQNNFPESEFSALKNYRDTVPSSGTFDFYLSSKGTDSNNGKSSLTPKRTFEGINAAISNYAAANKGASIGLEAGSRFRDELDISQNGIRISSFGQDSGKKFPLITGMDVVRDWKLSAGRQNVYESSITHTVDLINPNYHYLFVAEIDTIRESLFPTSSIRYLTLATSVDQCEKTAGSFYLPALTQNPVTICIHASQGTPGSNRYRYEVVTRPYGIYSFYNDNSTIENLFLQSSGNGYGMLGAGENTTVNNVVFQGGGTHHAVIKSGAVNRSLFLPGPKGLSSEIALVFYAPEGNAHDNRITNSIFLDIQNPVLTHTNGATAYRSLTIDSTFGFADTLNKQTMFSTDNTDSVSISNNYSYGYKNFWVGLPRSLTIRNSIIDRATEAAVYLGSGVESPCNATVSNTLITTNANDANQGPPVFQPSMCFRLGQKSTSLKATNIIFYGKSTWHTQYETETVFYNTLDNKVEATNNIYICEVNPDNYMHVINANNTGGKGTASNIKSDYNVYILLKGIIYWTAYPNSPQGDGNIFSLSDWQAFTGQDQHSVMIDLRNNPAGLKAIFTDPENGNWTLAQTPQGDSVRKLNAGMLTPPSFYPLRPVYEDVLSYTTLGGLSYLRGARDANHQLQLEWKTIDEPNLVYFGVESSPDKINFSGTANVHTQGRHQNNLYSFNRSDTSSARVYFRLRLVNTDSSYTYSSTIFVDPSKKDSIINGIGGSPVGIVIYPNPVQNTLIIEHPVREQAQISIFDYSGKFLRAISVQTRASSTLLPVQMLPAGNYLIKWQSGKENKTLPFLKTR